MVVDFVIDISIYHLILIDEIAAWKKIVAKFKRDKYNTHFPNTFLPKKGKKNKLKVKC